MARTKRPEEAIKDFLKVIDEIKKKSQKGKRRT